MNYLRGKYTPALYIAPSSLLPQHPTTSGEISSQIPPPFSLSLSVLIGLIVFLIQGKLLAKRGHIVMVKIVTEGVK